MRLLIGLPSFVGRNALSAPGDPTEMVERVAAILGDDALHADAHREELENAHDRFSIGRMATECHQLFSALVEGSGHGVG